MDSTLVHRVEQNIQVSQLEGPPLQVIRNQNGRAIFQHGEQAFYLLLFSIL